MEASLIRIPSADETEVRQRRAQLAALESALAQRELELATLKAELRAVDLLYLRKVGMLLMQLDVLDIRINDLLIRFDPDNLAAKKKAQQARRQATRIGPKVKDARSAPEERTHFVPSDQLKNLYREAAKRIHPDLAINDADRNLRTQWMIEVNAAYQAGNEARLCAILEDWNNSPESIQGEEIQDELERLRRKILQVEKRLQSIAAEMDRLSKTFACGLKRRIEEARLEGRDLLEEIASKLQKRIQKKQALLDDLQKKAPRNP